MQDGEFLTREVSPTHSSLQTMHYRLTVYPAHSSLQTMHYRLTVHPAHSSLQTVHYRLTVYPAHSSKVIGDSVEVVDWLGVIHVLTELGQVQTTVG